MSVESYRKVRRQSGLGLTGYLLVLCVGVFIGLFALKVVPLYLQNWTVVKVAEDLAGNTDILRQPRSQVYQYLEQAYRTNNLWDLKPEDTITLERDGKKGYIVSVQYERRANLFHNIDLVTSFDKTAN